MSPPFKHLPQLNFQMDSQRERKTICHFWNSLWYNLEKQRLYDADMSICMSGRQLLAVDLTKHIKILALLVLRRRERKVAFLFCPISKLQWASGSQSLSQSQFPSLLLPLIKWSWLHSDGPWRLIPDMCRIHLANLIKAAPKSGSWTKAWIIT